MFPFIVTSMLLALNELFALMFKSFTDKGLVKSFKVVRLGLAALKVRLYRGTLASMLKIVPAAVAWMMIEPLVTEEEDGLRYKSP